MATLLPSLSSDEEDNNKNTNEAEKDISDDEVDGDFEFGGILVSISIFWMVIHLCGCRMLTHSSLGMYREKTVVLPTGWHHGISMGGPISQL